MATFFGAIADDFTGATDLAGLLARSGAAVSLRIGVPDDPPENTAAFEVIALKCRTAPVDEAVADCRAALRWLQAAGAERFFWKYCSTFDSTAEGNIGPVAEALMADLNAEQTMYCPAFPENGRSIFMGNLFVGRAPLGESPMKDHPLTPMRDSNLMRLLAPQVKRRVGLVDRLTVAQGPDALRGGLLDLASQGIAHIIVDAVADDDLTTIAAACRDMPLMTGGSAVAKPLPGLYRADGHVPEIQVAQERLVPPATGIVLSGSCSEATRAQVARYLERAPGYQLDPLKLVETGVAPVLDWLSSQTLDAMPLVYASAAPTDVAVAQERLGMARAGQLVEDALAEVARAAFALGASRFVVAGGETSGAVTKALAVDRLDIGPEIAPGVPWTFCESAGRPIALTLKSGNFGDVDFFFKACQVLDQL